MKKLIFLNGCINSGKSTIGKLLIEKCSNLACVEVDALHGFIPWMEIDEAVPLNIRNGLDVSRNFIHAGMDVVFAYPLSDKDFEYIKTLVDFECKIEAVTLYCSLEENLRNRGGRELNAWEIERIKWMHKNGLASPGFSEIIDTTNRKAQDIAEQIIRLYCLK